MAFDHVISFLLQSSSAASMTSDCLCLDAGQQSSAHRIAGLLLPAILANALPVETHARLGAFRRGWRLFAVPVG
jgi:hypothetical protein